jgi:hypothetical protein
MGKITTLFVALVAIGAGFVLLRSGETLRLVGNSVRPLAVRFCVLSGICAVGMCDAHEALSALFTARI